MDTTKFLEPNTKEADRLMENMKRTMEHPWSAINDGYVWTLDGVDLRSPIKQFPKLDYLKEATNWWMKERLIAFPKSRRMMMSWMATW